MQSTYETTGGNASRPWETLSPHSKDPRLTGSLCWLWIESSILALDRREGVEHHVAGYGAGGLFLPYSCDWLRLGCCPHSPRTLGYWPGVDGLCSRRAKDKACQHRSVHLVLRHIRRPLLFQLQRRGHLQSSRPAMEQIRGCSKRTGRWEGDVPSQLCSRDVDVNSYKYITFDKIFQWFTA